MKYRIILASKSPRRRELLSIIEPDYVTAPDRDVEENYPANLKADEVPAYLSQLKSRAYAADAAVGDIIITADTVVILGDEILGKPADTADAVEMLRKLSGRTHRVVTGVTICAPGAAVRTFTVTTDVTFSNIAESDIEYYVEHYMPLDKAGAYGIQEWIGAVAVEKISGSYYNVVGLPLHKLFHELRAVKSELSCR